MNYLNVFRHRLIIIAISWLLAFGAPFQPVNASLVWDGLPQSRKAYIQRCSATNMSFDLIANLPSRTMSRVSRSGRESDFLRFATKNTGLAAHDRRISNGTAICGLFNQRQTVKAVNLITGKEVKVQITNSAPSQVPGRIITLSDTDFYRLFGRNYRQVGPVLLVP